MKQGQRIGTVAAPTKYGVALGEHLIFAMEKNGEPQNPMEKMKKMCIRDRLIVRPPFSDFYQMKAAVENIFHRREGFTPNQ